MISLKNGMLTDGYNYVDVDEITSLEQNHHNSFVVISSVKGDEYQTQFNGNSQDLIDAMTIVNGVQ